MRSVGWSAAVVIFIGLSSGCDGETATVDSSDSSPPDPVAMDAHLPKVDGTSEIVTVTASSGNRSHTLGNFPTITLIANARDPQSAIKGLRIDGDTTVFCEMGELGQNKHAAWLKRAPISDPVANPILSLNVDVAELRRSCTAGYTFVSVKGEFFATAANGVDLSAKTGSFSFRRP